MQTKKRRNPFIIGTDGIKCHTIGSINKFIVNKQLVWKCHSCALQRLLNLSPFTQQTE